MYSRPRNLPLTRNAPSKDIWPHRLVRKDHTGEPVRFRASTCLNTWKHGISQVRLYDPYGLGDVARYLSKGRFSSAADCEGANTYELRKFNRADWIYISPAAWAEMREARTVARRMSPL